MMLKPLRSDEKLFEYSDFLRESHYDRSKARCGNGRRRGIRETSGRGWIGGCTLGHVSTCVERRAQAGPARGEIAPTTGLLFLRERTGIYPKRKPLTLSLLGRGAASGSGCSCAWAASMAACGCAASSSRIRWREALQFPWLT